MLNIISFDKLASLDALSSFLRQTPPENFSQTLNYKNPVTGEEDAISMEGLIERATLRTSELWRALDRALMGEPFTVKGTSLNFDVMDSDSSSAKYFSVPSLIG